jgi:hypothetical protein
MGNEAIGYQLSAIGYQPDAAVRALAISSQQSAVSAAFGGWGGWRRARTLVLLMADC